MFIIILSMHLNNCFNSLFEINLVSVTSPSIKTHTTLTHNQSRNLSFSPKVHSFTVTCMNKVYFSGRLFQCHSVNSPILPFLTATVNISISTYIYWMRHKVTLICIILKVTIFDYYNCICYNDVKTARIRILIMKI